MRLADHDISIRLDQETIYLRPSLRAAFRLEQKYNGFHNLLGAVANGSVSAVADVIREGSGKSSALTDYLDSACDTPLVVSIGFLINPICAFVTSLAGVETGKQVTTGKPITFVDYHTKLFGIATGWLGWTPEQAWNATPAEILAAQEGRIEMLAAIYGGKKTDETALDRTNKDHLNAIGDLTINTMAQVPPCR